MGAEGARRALPTLTAVAGRCYSTGMATARWALLVGPKGGVRSSTARRLAARLSAAGLRVAGFVQEGEGEGGQERISLRRLGHRDRCTVARPGGAAASPAEDVHCERVFALAAFDEARAWAEADAPGADVVVVDAAGKLEAGGRGHHPAIAALLPGRALPILSVRDEHLFAIMEAFRLEEPAAVLTAPCTDAELEGFVAAVRKLV